MRVCCAAAGVGARPCPPPATGTERGGRAVGNQVLPRTRSSRRPALFSPPVPAAASAATPPPLTPQPPPSPPDGGLAGPLADPKVVDLMQRVAAGAVSPDAAARAMRDMSAGYQQVMDIAGK